MGMFDFLKPKKEVKPETQSLSEVTPSLPPTPELSKSQQPAIETRVEPEIKSELKKEELDLILSKIDNLRLNHEMLQEKIDRIEKMLKELYDMAKS